MQRRNVSRRLLGLMLAGVLLVAGTLVGWLNPLAAVATQVSQPLQAAFSGAGLAAAGWFTAIGAAGRLEAQNQRLQAQVAALQQQVSQDAEIKAQNDSLRAQLGLGSLTADHLVAAEVIGYQPDNFRQFLTIARGSRDGISPGMAVVEQGQLVGIIDSTGPHTAKVFLVIDPNFKVAALDQTPSDRPSGTVHGQIGNGLEMDEIAQNETINPGDTIVTSGLGGSIEKGLIIGQVQTTSKQDNGVFQTAQVTSSVQFSQLDIVYVVVRPQ